MWCYFNYREKPPRCVCAYGSRIRVASTKHSWICEVDQLSPSSHRLPLAHNNVYKLDVHVKNAPGEEALIPTDSLETARDERHNNVRHKKTATSSLKSVYSHHQGIMKWEYGRAPNTLTTIQASLQAFEVRSQSVVSVFKLQSTVHLACTNSLDLRDRVYYSSSVAVGADCDSRGLQK